MVFLPAFIQLVWEATAELELFELLGTLKYFDKGFNDPQQCSADLRPVLKKE